MNDLVFMEIAHEIKGLHNGALGKIREERFAEAEELYRKCLTITERISFHEGSAVTLFSMANLATLQDDLPMAIQVAERALTRYEQAGIFTGDCDALLAKLALAAKKRGIELERQGEFSAAVAHFEAAIPHTTETIATSLRHEAALLRRIINERERTNCCRPATA